ncbi:hypothetical protein ACJIZ3_007396 [Penstemon smallii]|uniref:CAAX prenyl protease 2/Lysostaphin resistance protein A-like domain-containing protein n=1 Tax=Penstemon smallii TaxID=265156 RepID=A0ABD3SAM2_9LAMI
MATCSISYIIELYCYMFKFDSCNFLNFGFLSNSYQTCSRKQISTEPISINCKLFMRLFDFSVLQSDIRCDIASIWSSLGFYVFSIHIPLSFGGLSAFKVLHQPVLDPQIEVILILAIQTLELCIVVLLLKYPGKPQYDLQDFFHANKSSKQRSWLLASIISCGSISATACILVYCIVTPLLEEIVYRGFLITSLVSEMKWPQTVVISSIIFSAVHFSGENFLQYLIIGIVLGCSYCWTGNLSSCIAMHSLYNALIFYLTFIS